MKNILKNSAYSKCLIMILIKRMLCVVLLFEVGLTRVQAQTVSDIEGNVYNTVTIGTQAWMKENLKTTKYNDGTAIPNLTTEWGFATTGAYCDFKDIPANSTIYGRLYNWYAVDNNEASKMVSNGGKNICPTGWHVSNDAEWTTLTDYLTNNGYGYQGSGDDIAKSMAATSGWKIYGILGTVGNDQASNNSSGFTALPSGSRSFSGTYDLLEYYTYWWSSSEFSAEGGYYRSMFYNYAVVDRVPTYKRCGFSVRCIKDITTDITNLSTSIIEVYPNPVSGILNIDYKNENFETVKILNSLGLQLTKEKVITPRQQIDFTKYSSGLYILEFVKESGEISRVKVVKN